MTETEQACIKADVIKENRSALKLAILCMVFYAISYICRKSFDSNINEIMDFYGQSKSMVGLIGTFFFIAYAIGQVIHGIMCKYYKPRIIIFVMALVVAGTNILMGIMPVSIFYLLKYIWCINGFACASFWSLLILTLNRCVANIHKPKVMLITCFPVSVGTFLSYGMSASLSFLHKFQWSFYVACGVMVAMGIVWLIFSGRLMNSCLEEKKMLDEAEPVATTAVNKNKARWPKTFIKSFVLLALFAIINNLVKDGINTWTPSILKETYNMENWLSVLLSVLVPFSSVFGGFLSIKMYQKHKSYTDNCSLLYLISGIILIILLALFKTNIWIITLVCLILVSVALASVNSFLTAIFPLNCEDGINAGMVAGVIDGFCYIGSAISSYGIGYIADSKGGWNSVLLLFIVLCIFTSFIPLIISLFRKRKPVTEA